MRAVRIDVRRDPGLLGGDAFSSPLAGLDGDDEASAPPAMKTHEKGAHGTMAYRLPNAHATARARARR